MGQSTHPHKRPQGREPQDKPFHLLAITAAAILLAAAILMPAAAQIPTPAGSTNSKPNTSAIPEGTPPGPTNPSHPATPANLDTAHPATPEPVHLPPVRTEEGTLGDSSYRIDIPSTDEDAAASTQFRPWNHSLVLFFHGYEGSPQIFALNPGTGHPNPPGRIMAQLLARGYAVAQPGYGTGGWAIRDATTDGEALRSYFAHHHGKPKETFVVGQSMGGLLTLRALEQFPHNYQAGLALCGVLAPADLVNQRAFANRVAFDAFFPNILPDVEHIPANFNMNDLTAVQAVQQALDAHPNDAALLRSLADIHTNRGLADVLVFNTFLIKDLRLKAGGNPFDNRNLIYTGTTDDNALNNRVKRYSADPAALEYLATYYSPTGDLHRRLLALHTLYDPLVPAATASYYDELTRRQGHADLFVQQYVVRDGHCNITPDQVGEAFDELVDWVHSDIRPTPGRLPDSTQQKPAHEEPTPHAPPKNIGKPE